MVREGELTSNRAIKLRIYPTEKQKKIMQREMNASIVSYNYGVSILREAYANWALVRAEFEKTLPENLTDKKRRALIGKEKSKFLPKINEISKELTALVNDPESPYHWLKQCCATNRCATLHNNLTQAMKKFTAGFEASKARANKKYAKALAKGRKVKAPQYPYDYGFPQFKSCRDSEKSYPLVIFREHVNIEQHRIRIEKIGWVRYSCNQEIPEFEFPSIKLANPVVSTDGRNYFVSFGFYQPNEPYNKPKTEVVGVDLGLKELAILHDGAMYTNPGKVEKIKKLNEKVKKLQRKYNWLQEHAEPMYAIKQSVTDTQWRKEMWKHETRQMKKIAKLKRKTQIKINNMRKNLMLEYANDICSRNPESIVVENLNVEGMRKNRKMASAVQQTGLYTFKLTLCNIAKKHEITVKEVDRFYPSSQNCSVCGERNPEMKDLSKRTFVCPHCGHTEDRDVNAAKNLKKMVDDPSVKIIA